MYFGQYDGTAQMGSRFKIESVGQRIAVLKLQLEGTVAKQNQNCASRTAEVLGSMN